MQKKPHPKTAPAGRAPQTYVDGKFVAPPPTVVPLETLSPSAATSGIEEFTSSFQSSHRARWLKTLFAPGEKAQITQCISLSIGNFLRVETVSFRFKEVKFNSPLYQLAMLEQLL